MILAVRTYLDQHNSLDLQEEEALINRTTQNATDIVFPVDGRGVSVFSLLEVLTCETVIPSSALLEASRSSPARQAGIHGTAWEQQSPRIWVIRLYE